MSQVVLTLNAGSSSVKFAIFAYGSGGFDELARGQVEGLGAKATFTAKRTSGAKVQFTLDPGQGAPDHRAAMKAILRWLGDEKLDDNVVAVGHRVLHGGRDFTQPAPVDAALLATLRTLIPLGELHEPFNILGIEAAIEAFPKTPQVACFDTAFHRAQPFVADVYGLPRSYYDEGVRRYGFHGLSYEYVIGKLGEVAPQHAAGRVIVAHLGNGASMCAIENGHSVASTLGFTAVDGLPMGTRTGALDPGVVLYLLQEKKMDAKQIETLLYKQSGLLGISGISNDMRVLMQSSDPHAKEAVDYFIYRICREMGSLAAAMGGVDGVIFTAGIGEHSPELRTLVLEQCRWLGLGVDPSLNTNGEGRISPSLSKPVYVIPTDEELMIAMHTRRMLTQQAAAE